MYYCHNEEDKPHLSSPEGKLICSILSPIEITDSMQSHAEHIKLKCLMIFLILGFAMAANLKAIRQVYSYFRKASDGCDGKADGFGGSLSPKSLADIFKLLKIVGRRVVDLGEPKSLRLFPPLYELPGNKTQKFVLDAVIVRMISTSALESCNCQWNAMDIDKVSVF